MNICEFCSIKYNTAGYGCCYSKSCHARFITTKRKDNRHAKYDDPAYRNRIRIKKLENDEKRFGVMIVKNRLCENPFCDVSFEIKYQEKAKIKTQKFCSRKCAATVIGSKNGLGNKKTRKSFKN